MSVIDFVNFFCKLFSNNIVKRPTKLHVEIPVSEKKIQLFENETNNVIIWLNCGSLTIKKSKKKQQFFRPTD